MITRCLAPILGVLFVPLLAGTVAAQVVPREEHERLKAEVAALKAELEQYLDLLDTDRDSLRQVTPGTTRFVVTGYAFTRYTSTRNGTSTFATEFSPIVLAQLNDRILFSAEPEFEVGDELEIALEYAHLSYMVTDFMTVGGGKFIAPFTLFNPRLHAAWINKLPTKPLAFAHGGLAPGSGVGAYVRGGLLLGTARASYAIYAINAPELLTSGHHAGEVEAVDASTERAYGGRAGLFLLPAGIELGYSLQTSDAATLHGVDLSLTRVVEPLAGSVDARVEAVLTQSKEGPFLDEDDPDEEMWLIDNQRNGGYGQLAYRPSLAHSSILRDLEGVVRFDWLDRPDWRGGPIGNDTNVYSFGLRYLIRPSLQVKAAFQHTNHTRQPNTDQVVFQAAVGF